MLVTPPSSVKTPTAPRPPVDTFVPVSVVDAPAPVKTPNMAAPWVEIVESATVATPPEGNKPPEPGPLKSP